MKAAICLFVAVALLGARTTRADEWTYDAVLYAWLTGLEGEMGVGQVGQAPVSASFEDLLGFVDFAMAAHFEARNPRTFIGTDIAYFNLGSEREATVARQTVEVSLDVQEWVFELGGGYRVTPEFDVLLAGRWYAFEFGADSFSGFGGSSFDNTQSWGDIYAGARYTKPFKEKWLFSVRGDIGTGGSEFAWFGNAVLGYHFNQTVSAGLAYRILSLDRQPDVANGEYLLYDMTQNGLGLGVGFGF